MLAAGSFTSIAMSYQQIHREDDELHLPLSENCSSKTLVYDESYQNLKSGRRISIPTLLSGIFNIILLLCIVVLLRPTHEWEISPYVGLKRDVSLPWRYASDFGSEDIEKAEKLWEGMIFEHGIVALDEKFVESKGLPKAQPFPWDTSKGIYILNGHHNLHCIKSLYTALIEYEYKRPQSYAFEHILHCTDTLRLDIICNADDTPRYTTRDLNLSSGMGQHRWCRDWSKLEKWADDNSACYHYYNYSTNTYPDQRERFVYCPEQSPYKERIKEYLKAEGGL